MSRQAQGPQAAPSWPRCWVAVVSHEHVRLGRSEGFAQACHGKAGPLSRMRLDDWLVFYSPTEAFGGPPVRSADRRAPAPCRAFTALARVAGEEVYQYAVSDMFVPWRRDVVFHLEATPAPIAPLIDTLSFLPNKQCWGYPFRRGHFEIPVADMARIAAAMGVMLDGRAGMARDGGAENQEHACVPA